MKTKLLTALLAIVCACSAGAQEVSQVPNLLTNQITSGNLWTDAGTLVGDLGLHANPTNLVADAGVGIGTHGKLAAWFVVAENINDNVGVIAGVDHLWFGGKAGNANIVSGGLTIKAPIFPIRVGASYLGISIATNTWAYSFEATPFVISLVGTPLGGTSNNGGLALINRAGVDFNWYDLDGWKFGTSFDFGNRSGAGAYNGNYFDLGLSVTKGF